MTIHRIFCVVIGAWILAIPGSEAAAHSIPDAFTLHDLCRSADVVAVGKITLIPMQKPNTTELPAVRAEIAEVLSGENTGASIWFWPHRHGNDEYVLGEEMLLFLQKTRAPERRQDAPYEAIEAIGDRFVIPRAARDTWIDAARQYVALGKDAQSAAEAKKLGRLSLTMLVSPEPKLAQFALRDLMLAGTAPVLVESDVPEVLRIVDDAKRPAMLRVGLLSELERRNLTPVGSHWVSVLDSATTNERSAVIAGAKARWFVPEVTAALVAILDRGAPDEAISAARAVGAEGNEAAVEALERAVSREPAELRYAALGSLRRINSVSARDKLARLAETHPEVETRKVARAELALLPPAPAAVKNPAVTNSTALVMTKSTKRILIVVGVLVLVFTAIGLGKQAKRAKEIG